MPCSTLWLTISKVWVRDYMAATLAGLWLPFYHRHSFSLKMIWERNNTTTIKGSPALRFKPDLVPRLRALHFDHGY